MSELLTCPACGSSDVNQADTRLDGRRRCVCEDCENAWLVGEAEPLPPPAKGSSQAKAQERASHADAQRSFAAVAQVDGARAERVAGLKERFLADHPDPDPEVAPYWERYRQVFTAEGLDAASPEDFHSFANSTVGAAPGNMSIFNTQWNRVGPEVGAERVRQSVRHLLHEAPERPLEERLGDLLAPGTRLGMTGWKEALLTKVLSVAQPERFLPVLTYASVQGGKRLIADRVFGLDLPAVAPPAFAVARLAVWSNDLLLELSGAGFETTQHASQFLWWAKDQDVHAGARV